jgi:hypothetical protein
MLQTDIFRYSAYNMGQTGYGCLQRPLLFCRSMDHKRLETTDLGRRSAW